PLFGISVRSIPNSNQADRATNPIAQTSALIVQRHQSAVRPVRRVRTVATQPLSPKPIACPATPNINHSLNSLPISQSSQSHPPLPTPQPRALLPNFTLPRQLPTPPFKSFFPLSRSKRIAPPTQPAALLARTKFPRADAFASALHPTILPFLARQASTKGAGDPMFSCHQDSQQWIQHRSFPNFR
ncbi:MAG: hypothetical protein ACI87A_003550, partial [Planctomycetota bacterium]